MTLRAFCIFLLTLLFTLLPFHTFFITGIDAFFFNETAGIPFVLAAWKDIALLLLGVTFFALLMLRKIPLPKLDILDILLIAYVSWALFTGLMRWEGDLLRILWGAKYSLSFLIFFLLVRHFPLEKDEKKHFFFLSFVTAGIVIFFGVLQKFLPADFLVHFGYSSEFSTFDPEGVTAYCQKISFTDTCRLQSFFSGPNQFSAYLLLVLPLLFFLTFHSFLKKKQLRKNAPARAFGATFFLLGIFCLIFAYSRAAWIGFLIAIGISFLILFRDRSWLKPLIGASGGVVSLIICTFLFMVPRPYQMTCSEYTAVQEELQQRHYGLITRFFCSTIFRPSSSQGHFERSRDGIEHILMHPWGTGLGDSGPASARFYENKIGFIPESWYLQVGIDTGWPGFILFMSILFFTGKKLLQTPDWRGQALFCALVGISIMSLKQHAWESVSVALTFWGLSAVAMAPEEKEISFWKLLWIKIHKLLSQKSP